MLSSGRLDDFQRFVLMQAMNEMDYASETQMFIGDMGICPIEAVTSTYIKIDDAVGPSGLLQAHGQDETVHEIPWGDLTQRKFRAPYWRAKYVVNERALTETRMLGSSGANQPLMVDAQMEQRVIEARKSIDITMAKLVVDALVGTIKVRYEDIGDTVDIKYNHSPSLTFDLSSISSRPRWSSHGSADPIGDIEDMKRNMRKHGAPQPDLMLMGAHVETNIIQCDAYNEWVQRTPAGVGITRSLELPEGRFLGMRTVVSEGTYPQRDRLAADVSSGADITLAMGTDGELADLKAGDSVVIGVSTATGSANAQAAELGEVSSISGNTVTLTANLTHDYKRGDYVTWHRPFVDPDDVFLLAPGDHYRWGVAESPHADDMASYYMYEYTDPTPIPMRKAVYFGVDGMPFFKKINCRGYLKT